VTLVLGDEHDSVPGRLFGPAPGNWLVAAYPHGDAKLDPKGMELPAALTRSDGTGAFQMWLPRGSYTLYALAPDAVRVVSRAGLDSRFGPWNLELPLAALEEEARGEVRTSDGHLLAHASVGIQACLDGAGGRRNLLWNELTSDGAGAFSFPHDPTVDVDVAASHPDAADVGETQAAAARAGMDVVLARPRYVQIAAASFEAESFTVLDAEGRTLPARGPLHQSDRFALSAGWSPVLEVPATARWLELAQPGSATVRLAIEPRAGQVLRVQP
jgi:hypothetical protein